MATKNEPLKVCELYVITCPTSALHEEAGMIPCRDAKPLPTAYFRKEIMPVEAPCQAFPHPRSFTVSL